MKGDFSTPIEPCSRCDGKIHFILLKGEGFMLARVRKGVHVKGRKSWSTWRGEVELTSEVRTRRQNTRVTRCF
jgi:hypothetical protein